MELVKTIPVTSGNRPEEMTLLDDTVNGLVTYSYRLVAVDETGNPSQPSEALSARAFDTSPPTPPTLTLTWNQQGTKTKARIAWSSPDEVLVQRRETGQPWVDLIQWQAPGSYAIDDPFSEPDRSYQYRARACKKTGAMALGAPVTLMSNQ